MHLFLYINDWYLGMFLIYRKLLSAKIAKRNTQPYVISLQNLMIINFTVNECFYYEGMHSVFRKITLNAKIFFLIISKITLFII